MYDVQADVNIAKIFETGDKTDSQNTLNVFFTLQD